MKRYNERLGKCDGAAEMNCDRRDVTMERGGKEVEAT